MNNRTFKYSKKDNRVWLDMPEPQNSVEYYSALSFDQERRADEKLAAYDNRENYPVEGNHNWEDQKILEENVDFVVRSIPDIATLHDGDWQEKEVVIPNPTEENKFTLEDMLDCFSEAWIMRDRHKNILLRNDKTEYFKEKFNIDL